MTALTDPEWLAHRYDPTHDAVHFVHATRAVRRSTPFLIDEYLKPEAPLVETRREAMAARPRAPVHFIFHSAFCCSTLLAAAFDVPGVATSFKEPLILNDITGWLHRGGDRRGIGEALDGALHLMTPFAGDGASVIKPSNVTNGLATAMLNLRPQARAILMYAPLRTFLVSIARKGMDGRLWARDLIAKQLAENFINLGFEPRDHLLHTDLQAAAVGWLAQRQLFTALAQRWPDRVRTLDSEVLIAAPREYLAAAAALYGVALSNGQIEAVVSDVFARSSKDGSAFTPGQRAAEEKVGDALHADEIGKVLVWAEAVADAAGVPMEAPLPLV